MERGDLKEARIRRGERGEKVGRDEVRKAFAGGQEKRRSLYGIWTASYF